jgi:beta-glucanase (GH16 family)
MMNTSTRHRQDEWHTYRCDWDSTRLTFYLDGNQVHTLYRFYRNVQIGQYPIYVKVAAGCNPAPGTYHTTGGYPYNDASNSHVRFSTSDRRDGTSTSSRTFQHEMEIDYVRICSVIPSVTGIRKSAMGPT